MIINKSIHFEKKKCSAGRNAKSHKIKIHEITFAKKNSDLVVNINIGLQRGNRGSRGRVTRGNRADVTRGSTVFLKKISYPRPRGFRAQRIRTVPLRGLPLWYWSILITSSKEALLWWYRIRRRNSSSRRFLDKRFNKNR